METDEFPISPERLAELKVRDAGFVAAIRKYAVEHYNQDGWDILVECYEDAEILEEIIGATSEERAILMIQSTLKILHEHRADIQAEAF